jgi:hypothetical protein
LPARFDSLAARFDANRPLVVSVTPADGARDVDPASPAIVVRFDRPMTGTYNVTVGPGGRARFPVVESASFDSTATTFSMRVRLEPERDYELVLGPGFRSVAGYPIRATTVRFRTGPRR